MWQIPAQAFLGEGLPARQGHTRMTEWPLPLRASRLMDCKVPFNISTGVRDNDPGALGGLRFNGRPRKSIPGKVLLERTGDVTHRAMGDYKSVIFF